MTPEPLQQLPRLVNEAKKDVLGSDVVVIEESGLLLSQHDHPSGSVSEAFKHGAASKKD